MARFDALKLAYDRRAVHWESFVRLVTRLRSAHEVRALTQDLFSSQEITMIMRRIHVARLMLAGVPCRDIRKRLQAGKSLVSRVAHRLARNGRGYETATRRLPIIEEELTEELRRAQERSDPASWESFMRKTWMMHWPELLGRELPTAIRDIAASSKRRKSLKASR